MSLRAALVAILVACAAPAQAPARVDVPPAPSGPLALASIDPSLERMSRARELSVLRDVKHVTMSRAAWIAKLEAHVAREIPRSEIESEQAFLRAFGAIPSDLDYERAVYDAIRTTGGGMYEPFDGTIYLPDDLTADQRERTLLHESVHALQDQHFDLRAFQRYLPGQTDTMLARSCLAEGDASNAASERFDYVQPETYVERELAASYLYGSTFVRALRARGGWAEVNRAWARPTLTTHEILHPEKWPGAPPEDVPAPTFATLGPSFRAASVDVKGELSLLLVLEAVGGAGVAASAVSGWAGDRAVVARDATRTALAWRVRFEDEPAATRLFSLFDRCNEARSSPIAAYRRDRDVLILAGPEGARCDLLARWSKEVLP